MKNIAALFCFIEDFFLQFKNTNDKKSTRKTELAFSELTSIYSLAVRFSLLVFHFSNEKAS